MVRFTSIHPTLTLFNNNIICQGSVILSEILKNYFVTFKDASLKIALSQQTKKRVVKVKS